MREGFLKALEQNEDDEPTRLVYADWLDEQGEYEEAARQRKWTAAKKWLVEFAKKHHAYAEYHDWEEEERTGKSKHGYPVDVRALAADFYSQFMEFLMGHLPGGQHGFGFDLPYGFAAYSDEMWENFEIVTGLTSPQGENRRQMPPFSCSC